jgi:hypothetical protein
MIGNELPEVRTCMRRSGMMIANRLLETARRMRGILPGMLGAAWLLCPTGGAIAGDATLKATYGITIAGITIGRAEAESRFTDTGYASSITGSTYGISRFVSDAHAELAGNGRISGTRVLPATYTLDTSEKGFETHVNMAMRGGSIVDVTAVPRLVQAPDRVPLTSSHKQNVVDPVGAFVVALNRAQASGETACDRTVRVFDGWQRYDVKLFYKETKPITGSSNDDFTGDVFVCGARYVPVAGHRPSRDSVKYMADNKRLEIWLAPIKDTTVMVPYRIVIGTKVGDLVIGARSFEVSAGQRQAQVN